MDFPVLHDPGSIEMLLRTVAKTDPPKTVDHEYLLSLGFKREVDEGLLKLLTFLGFVDEHGRPTVLWVNYNDQGPDSRILGKAIMAAYGSLFDRFPVPSQEEGSVLMDFFRDNTDASDPDAAYMVLTFKVLCDLAGIEDGDFDEDTEEAAPKPAAKEPAKKEEKKEEPRQEKKVASKAPEPPAGMEAAIQRSEELPPLRISINIDLDENSDPDLRELAVKLLRKHLEL